MRPNLGGSAIWRPFRLPARFASTNSTVEAAQKKAQDSVNGLQKNAERAWEGAKAGSVQARIDKGWDMAKNYFGFLGDKAGRLLGSYQQPIVYNLSVTRELLKQIYIAERLTPPTSLSTLQSAYSTLWTRASSLAYWKRIMTNGELPKVGIYAVEAYGIFKIGEILGRRSLVGYNLH